MATKLRIKGRMLLIGNTCLLHLILATGVMLILCVNFSVLTYELFLKKSNSRLADFSVSLLLLLLSAAVCWLMHLGTVRFFLRRSQGMGESAADLFRYFNPMRSPGALAFGVGLVAIKIFYFALSIIPFGIIFYILVSALHRGVSALVAAFLAVGCVLLFISSVIFYKSITASLFLCKYHYVCGDCISFRQIITSSFQDMEKRKRLLMRLKGSFGGWFFLSLLILPSGYVWSYYNQTLAVAASEFMGYEKNEADGYLQ